MRFFLNKIKEQLDVEVKTLLALKNEFKQASGLEWKPDMVLPKVKFLMNLKLSKLSKKVYLILQHDRKKSHSHYIIYEKKILRTTFTNNKLFL